ncbi:hypothetical protein AMTR_s00101p00034540 [Amborella trichopoda]|uniref:Uncharacterized protein n=1 Tax=Amborella trichopoda TaxID=13333 RepID=W1NTX2_AMBTC|nr:hypothetical protein AMTR_s00101p00034540 [Amborella trichopoda]
MGKHRLEKNREKRGKEGRKKGKRGSLVRVTGRRRGNKERLGEGVLLKQPQKIPSDYSLEFEDPQKDLEKPH